MAKQSLENENYAAYTNSVLLQAYREATQRLKHCIKDLTIEDLKAKPIPGKWSVIEIIIHLADSEIIGSCRFRQAYAKHPDPFPYYNEKVWTEIMKYQQQSTEFMMVNLDLFDLLRKTTANLLSTFNEADWEKTGIHPERGEMTIRGLLELYADHSERHIDQILERRNLLGKPLQMELLLKKRLY